MSALFHLLYFIAVSHVGDSNLCDKVIQLNGALGKHLVLYQLPSRPGYETLSLKSTNKNTKMKLLAYNLTRKQVISKAKISDGRYQFDPDNSSVIIRELQKDDEKDYELTVEKEDGGEYFCTIELKVYEQISNLILSVTEESQNDTCKVTMRCLMKTGENVTFSWMKDGKTLSHDGGTLEIGITADNASSTFRCTAKNPVSEDWSDHTLSSTCNPDKENGHRDVKLYILVPSLFILLAIIVVVIVVIKKKCKRDMHSKQRVSPRSMPENRPSVPEPESEQKHEVIQTVYATVEKSKNQNINSGASNSIPFPSLYELAGPCRYNTQEQNLTEETRV